MENKPKKRVPLTKKIRFEVFKRDSFTCQYCGRMAPDVVLEVDHIVPVADGGTNDIMNLVTSCHDCNSGKGKRRLSENEELKKQQEQLKLLNQRREQMEMIVEWRKQLKSLDEEEVFKIEDLFKELCDSSFKENGKKTILNLIKKYGFMEVYDCTIISIEKYFIENDSSSAEKAFNYIGRICYNRKVQSENPILKDVNYIVKMAKNKMYYCNEYKLRSFLKFYLDKDDIEQVKEFVKTSRNWTELKKVLYWFYDVSEGL